LPVPMYHLKAAIDDEVILGGFYPEELSPVKGDTFEIEKVLKRRKKGKKEEVLVSWKGFSHIWDSWIDAKSIKNLKK